MGEQGIVVERHPAILHNKHAFLQIQFAKRLVGAVSKGSFVLAVQSVEVRSDVRAEAAHYQVHIIAPENMVQRCIVYINH